MTGRVTYKVLRGHAAYRRHPELKFVAVLVEARCGGELIGHANLKHPMPGDPMGATEVRGIVPYALGDVYVDKAFRGRGIGGQLVARCVALAGPAEVIMEVCPYRAGGLNDQQLVRFYGKAGFTYLCKVDGAIHLHRPAQ